MADVTRENPLMLADWNECLNCIANSVPETEPGQQQMYHYLSFGWLCGGIIEVHGVPVRASTLDGIDSFLSIVQMPRGVPVATVAINNATNAGLLAVRMLGVGDSDLVARMSQY